MRGWRVMVQIVVLTVVLGFVVWPRLERYFLLQAAQQNAVTQRLATDGLRAALDRYAPLPPLIAERPELVELLRNPDDAELRAQGNAALLKVAEEIAASDVYLMDLTGDAIIASNYLLETSFVGENFDFRPYFFNALEQGWGEFFARGTTSGLRGYFYGAPVTDGTDVLGVLALKFGVSAFEEGWRAAGSDIIVTDARGVIFMSTRPDWHFRAVERLTPATLAAIEQNRQYPLDRVSELDVMQAPLDGAATLMTITGTEYVATSSASIKQAGWTVTTLVPAAPARVQAMISLALLAVLGLAATLAAAYLRSRSAQQDRARRLLEKRVKERTSELRHEVEERRAAEEELRRTQTSLVQAGKLSALGQMSAALSHEFNQPLAAVKSYAENAAAFLDRGKPDQARDNVMRISRMTDRMAAISKHLRNFARRPQEAIGPVALGHVIDEALAVANVRLKADGVRVHYDPPVGEAMALGGHVRLQQVIVNLITNAVDAMAGQDRPSIHIAVTPAAGTWQVTVRDHGPGIAEETIAQMFDPFFTTKETGKGLGLGLSISFNIVRDFGGTLWGRNHPDGGAIFGVDLIAAPAIAKEAAE